MEIALEDVGCFWSFEILFLTNEAYNIEAVSPRDIKDIYRSPNQFLFRGFAL